MTIDEQYVSTKARLWATMASQHLYSIFQAAAPLFDRKDLDLEPDSRRVLRSLNISCHLTSESLLVLVREERLWDSEMLMRSINEGSIRFFYLASEDKVKRKQRVLEYDKIMPQIDMMRWHDRAKRFLDVMPDPKKEDLRPIRELLLSPDKLDELRTAYPKRKRQELANKWSFSELVRLLAEEDPKRYSTLGPLGHGYNVGSQLLHQSADGIGVIRDRTGRSLERRLAVELGHAARLISDTLSMAKVRALTVFRVFKQDGKVIKEIADSEKPLNDEMEDASRYFHSVEYGDTLEEKQVE